MLAITSGRPGAFEEDHALDEIGIDARLGGGRLDLRPVRLDPARRREHAVRALLVDHVAVAGRGALAELLLAVRLVGEGIVGDLERGELGRVVSAAQQREGRQPGNQYDESDQEGDAVHRSAPPAR